MNRVKRVLSNTITTNKFSSYSVEGVFRKEFLYSVVSSGGLLFYAVVRLVRMLQSDWYGDVRYDWYRGYVFQLITLLIVSALCILFASDNKWFNGILATFILFFEYESVIDYDIEWHCFRITIFNIAVFLLVLSSKLFWTRLLIIASRLVWMSLWVAYTVIFIYLLHTRNHNIAYMYMCLVSLLLITMTLSLETFEVLSVITTKLIFLPSMFILLCPIYITSAHPSDSIVTDLVAWFPLLLLSVSCYCFCKYLSLNKQIKQTHNFKIRACKALVSTLFILLAIVYCEIYKSICST